MIGRINEIKELNRLYDSNRAEFVAVYGRRRVGKTYLIDETFEGRFTFRYAGLSPVGKEKKNLLKENNSENNLTKSIFLELMADILIDSLLFFSEKEKYEDELLSFEKKFENSFLLSSEEIDAFVLSSNFF